MARERRARRHLRRQVLPQRAVRGRGACYRAALEGAPGDAELTAKLERASASAATGLAAGEQQRELFRDLFSRDRLLAGPDLAPSPETPPPLGPHRVGIAALAHDALIGLGQAAGAIGSFVLHRLTDFLGRRGTNDVVWTNWHSSGKGLPAPVAKVVQILKLAYMREQLFANNLVRPYPTDAKTAFYGTDHEPPAGVRRWRTADGSWNNAAPRSRRSLRSDGRRGVHAVLPQRRRRPRPRGGAPPRRTPRRTRSACARSAARSSRPRASAQLVPFLNLWAAAWIQFMNHDWVSHGTLGPDAHRRAPARRRRPVARALRPRPPRRAAHRRRPDAPARRRRPAADVHQRGHALVGRLAALRQRSRHAGEAAQRCRRQAHRDRRRPASRRSRHRHRADRVLAQLVGGARRDAHVVRPRAQRDLRSAQGRAPRLGRRGAVPDRAARERGGDGEDPHRGVDAGDPAEPHAARRHARELVRARHEPVRRASASRRSRRSRSPTASSAASSATRRAASPTTG